MKFSLRDFQIVIPWLCVCVLVVVLVFKKEHHSAHPRIVLAQAGGHAANYPLFASRKKSSFLNNFSNEVNEYDNNVNSEFNGVVNAMQHYLKQSPLVDELHLQSNTRLAQSQPLTNNSVQETSAPSQPVPKPRPESEIVAILPYDEEIYDLSYKTFLASRNLNDAYRLALEAVKQNPDNLVWRERLALVATWTQHPKVALAQWQYLAQHGQDTKKVIDNLINLAIGLRDDPVLVLALHMRLKQEPDNEIAWQQLIAAYERMHQPETAMTLLRQAYAKNPKKLYILLIAQLYENVGEPKRELTELDEISKKYGSSPDIALRQAEILYDSGDIHGALKKLLPARAQAKPTDVIYWRTLSDLAWMAQDHKDALDASQILYNTNQATVETYERMINLLRQENPELAYKLAKEAWKKYRNLPFYISILDIGSQLRDWETLKETHSKLTSQEKQQLSQLPYFWTTTAELWQQLNQPEKARAAYQTALQQDPESITLRSGYIFLLIAQQNRAELEKVLNLWEQQLPDEPELWDAYANAYLFLNKPHQALELFQKLLPTHLKDYPWLTAYAATLVTLGYEQQAQDVSNYIWKSVQRDIANTNQPLTTRLLFPYAELALTEAPGDGAANAMYALGHFPADQYNRNLILVWAVSMGNYGLANYLVKYYKFNNYEVPPVVALSIDYDNNDLPAMENLLTNHPKDLTYIQKRDAAQRLGNNAMEQQYAFDGMEYNQTNNIDQTNDYQQFSFSLLNAANSVSVQENFVNFGALQGFNTAVRGKFNLTPDISIKPYANYMQQWTSDSDIITNVPSYDQSAGVNLDYKTNRGIFEIGGGERDAMHDFGTAHLKDIYQWSNNLTTEVMLGYNQRSLITTPMYVGGVQNMAQFSFNYDFDNKNYVVGQVEGDYYTDQTGNSLGAGASARVEVNHRFSIAYPDILVRAFGSYNEFSRHGTPGPSISSLVPFEDVDFQDIVTDFTPETIVDNFTPEQVIDSDFFIPNTFVQTGVGFSIGDLYRDNYSDAIRPYLSANIFYNSDTKIGYDTEAGLSTKVIGDDQLSLFFALSQGAGGIDQLDGTLGLRYKYLF